MSKAGWCERCGRHYETPTRPDCECAGEPPVRYDGRRLSTLSPDGAAYYARVRRLRFIPPPSTTTTQEQS